MLGQHQVSFSSPILLVIQLNRPSSVVAGDEAELIATATALPKVTGAYPLLDPTLSNSNSSSSKSKDSFDIMHSWGNLSPMWSLPADTWGVGSASPLMPECCELSQVHLLHRHGARYPSGDSSIAEFGEKLNNATVSGTGFTAKGDLAFLNTWMNKLGAELLTPFGRQQL